MSYTHRTTVYLVHDDPVVAQAILDFLSYLGYSVVPVASIQELLDALAVRRQKADLVVAKLAPAGQVGAYALRKVHQQYPQVAFVLITDGLSSLPAAEAVSCGVYAYLRQPIQFSELELLLARLGESNTLARLCGEELRFGHVSRFPVPPASDPPSVATPD
jgi:DNA-binding NtrC family response regulator